MSKILIVLSHPTGNANVRAVMAGFANAKILSEFHTSLAVFPGHFLERLYSYGPLNEILRRSFDPTIRSLTKTYPYREIGRLLAIKAGFAALTKHENGIFSIDAVYNSLDKYTSRRLNLGGEKRTKFVYSYED